jgi:hypothetical protein
MPGRGEQARRCTRQGHSCRSSSARRHRRSRRDSCPGYRRRRHGHRIEHRLARHVRQRRGGRLGRQRDRRRAGQDRPRHWFRRGRAGYRRDLVAERAGAGKLDKGRLLVQRNLQADGQPLGDLLGGPALARFKLAEGDRRATDPLRQIALG